MEHLRRFLDYLRYEKQYTDCTLTSYEGDLNQYVDYVLSLGLNWIEPSEGDKDLLRSWLSQLMDDGYKTSSVQRKLSAVKAFYKYFVRVGELSKNPMSSVRGPRSEKPLPTVLDQQTIESLLDDTEVDLEDFIAVRDQLLFEVLFETGIRRSELVSLKLQNVDLTERQIKVYGKGRKERVIPFGESLRSRIERYLELRSEKVGESEVFFVSLKNKGLKGDDVYQIVHRKLEKVSGLARRGPHVFRHTFATAMLNNGADLLSVKELLGHSSISTTVRYTHTSLAELKQMYNAHPRVQKIENVMDIRIQSVHFTMKPELEAFIQKKVDKLSRLYDAIDHADVVLKLDAKSDREHSKVASIRLDIPGPDLFAEKESASFEESIDLAVDALKRQIEKLK